jgi:hypothetical protein
MLPTVGLHDKMKFDAGEVGNELRDRMLSSEFMVCKAAIAEQSPKEFLRIGLMPPEVPCPFADHDASLRRADEEMVIVVSPSPAPLTRRDLSRIAGEDKL